MKSALPGVLRLIAILLLVGGVCLGALDAYGAAKSPVLPEETFASRLPALAEAVTMVLGLVGLAVLMYGLAVIMEAGAGPSDNAELTRSISELRQSGQKLETAVQRLVEQRGESPAHGPASLGEVSSADTVAGTALAASESMHQVMVLLQEIRELALMNDAQRQEKLREAQQHRRNYMVTELQRLLDLKEWGAAEGAMSAIASEFPSDSGLEELQGRVAAGRKEAERDSFSQIRERVEDLMAVWAWDQAYSDTARFVENFPDHSDGRELLTRVKRERDAYIEETASRLYEEIRSDIDRRLWRRAMTNAVKLLECAPGHRRSVAIRAQIKTIRDNAEIEERQEEEARIQEMIRMKQFPEAIELAEDLLRRFPNSPQAESLQKLLPKMRELAIGHEVEA
ncbi:MAG TPA: hypothetical protein VHX86_04045 [Tepidisphaeraceae bacterium]|jgi:outer membrane protein assembly factor BamD (BamD/ComL family)|nr:hypothetical protein [Tepidisphaeraceae bacterium]